MKTKIGKNLFNLFVITCFIFSGITTYTQIASADSGTVIQSSYADFAQGCTTLSQNTSHVSDEGGGGVELAATLSDDFPGTTLDTINWTSGKWEPVLGDPYTPTITNSLLIINPNDDAWVRSVNTFTHGVLEATAQFTTGAFEHIGFGSDTFSGNRYFLFSTFTGDGNLYARVSNGGAEQNLNLGVIPAGLNRYRIEWTLDGNILGNDLITFYIDGDQVAQFSLTNSGATGFYLYLSNDGAGTLNVDYAQAGPTYQSTGIYTSCPFDAGAGNAWQTLSWDATQTANTTLSVKTRTSPDGVTWNKWSDLNNSGDNIGQPDRWLQYQLILGTSDANKTPLVNSVSRTFGTAQADLSIVKTVSANTIDAHGVLGYFLTVINNGPDGAASITITDTLPTGVTNVNTFGAGWNCSSSTSTMVRCSTANLPLGDAPVISITLNAPAEAGIITNSAILASTTNDPVAINNTSNTVTTTVTGQADLSIVKSGPATVNASGVLSYTLNVSNAGPSTASSLTVSDTLPAGVTNASASGSGWNCGVSAGLLTCTRLSLGVTTAPAITIQATAPAEGGSIQNKASVSSATADPVAVNNTSNTVTTTVTGQADLSIDGVGNPESVKMGGLITYTLTVSNTGPSTGNTVKVSYILPGGVSFVSASGTGWNCNLAAGKVSCLLQQDLARGAASPLMIIVHAPRQGGQLTSIFNVSSNTSDPNPTNDSKEITSSVEFGIYLPVVMR